MNNVYRCIVYDYADCTVMELGMLKSHLYILVYAEKKVIKIGKADDIIKRITNLKKYWGEPDYKCSYSLELNAEEVLKIERSLHLFLSEHSFPFAKGDGKTEFFTIECLDRALEYIALYIKGQEDRLSLKKGIEIPVINKDISKKIIDYKLRKYKKATVNLTKSMNEITTTLEFLIRVVGILMKHRSQIKYSYTFDEEYIYFTIEDKRLFDLIRKNDAQLHSLFKVGFIDFNGLNVSVSFLVRTRFYSKTQSKFLLQFQVKCFDGSEYSLASGIFFEEEFKKIVLSLPPESPAYIQARNIEA